VSIGKIAEDISSKIGAYKNRASVNRRSHYLASAKDEQKNSWLGVPVVIIAALVVHLNFRHSARQPKYSCKNSRRHFIDQRYGVGRVADLFRIQREIGKAQSGWHEIRGNLAVFGSFGSRVGSKGDLFADEAIEGLKKITAMLDETAKESPTIPDRVYKIAADELGYVSPSLTEIARQNAARDKATAPGPGDTMLASH
jgi:hypothetical protein